MNKRIALAVILASLALPSAAQRIAVNPVLPGYGQNVAIEVRETGYQVYLPATRYAKSGSTITIDYEYLSDGFGPFRPDRRSCPWANCPRATTRCRRASPTSRSPRAPRP